MSEVLIISILDKFVWFVVKENGIMKAQTIQVQHLPFLGEIRGMNLFETKEEADQWIKENEVKL